MTLHDLATRLVEELYHLHGNVGEAATSRVTATTGELMQTLLRILPDTLGIHHSSEPLRCTECLKPTNGYSLLMCPKCFHEHVKRVPKVEAELAGMGKQALLDHVLLVQGMVESQSAEIVALRGIIEWAGIEHNV